MVDPDCYLWSNDQSQLCYNCNACKAGLLGNLREEWRKANIILTVAVVVLIWVYLIACSAFKNAQTEDLFRRYKRGWQKEKATATTDHKETSALNFNVSQISNEPKGRSSQSSNFFMHDCRVQETKS
ncbi:hypothetical protein JHK82_043375 [Glycine max]|nr:hypothetical protein JHK82_043375 [Glycine max]